MDITEVPRKQAKGKKKSSKTSRNESREQDHVAESQAKDPAPQDLSEIKNKQRRHEMFMKLKQEKRKQKMQVRKARKKERDALGDKAPPKEVPKTIENQRVYDETTVDPDDEERTVRFCEQLATVIPNAHVYYRRGLALKRVIPQCVARGFTYLMVINEDRKRRGKEPTEHTPEVILNNFTTRLGHSIGRLFAALFPHDPQFVGRQVATFHNQRDFVFFRFHRYIFKNEKRVGIQELGPRFTLKLRSLQKGTFDSKFGEYEWVLKRHEMDACRRKFFL
ncbi:hypothetical protein CRUP_020718 [Coryphaenoides rupestris]|nr:hypothetical protein CRUP_020718 [Coryphaenoides rupestris]